MITALIVGVVLGGVGVWFGAGHSESWLCWLTLAGVVVSMVLHFFHALRSNK